uniref:Uncharacterized protein n=1 Tax=Tanacetum cinerariifolium TaxID=118510 RepID=A0A6L2KKP5_TANCI|nr:hypothetical protein [Tanacetum cinerariifolium]
MMVQAPKKVGEGLEVPTDTHHTPIITQPSSTQPQKKQKSRRTQRKETEVPHTEPQTKESVPATSNDPLPSEESQEAREEEKSRTSDLKRLWKVGSTTRVESSEDKETGENVKQSTKDAEKEVSTVDPVTTADETLIETKAAKPKARGVMVQEPNEFRTTSSSQPPQAKDKAQKLQTKEQEKLTNAEKARLFMEFLEKRRKFFSRKREIEKRNRPPTKAQQRSLMRTYLKNIDGWKHKNLKKKSFDEIQKLFDSVMKMVNIFVDMNTEIVKERSKKTQAEVTKGSSKRAGDELEQESAKRQRLEKEDDSAELKRCLEIVHKDDDVTIKATPLSSTSLTIVDYKIYKEGKKSYFKTIRADCNSQNYLTFGKMFKNFNREDLKVLWSIVKERFKKTKPVDDMDNILFQTLKTIFEHHVEDNI